MELNKIYNMDCLEGLKQLEDNSIDLIVTDPPYAINIAEWDKELPSEEIFKEIYRVIRKNGQLYLFGNLNCIAEFKNICENVGFKLLGWNIWDKGSISQNSTRSFADVTEHCLHFFKPLDEDLKKFGKYIKKKRTKLNLSLRDIGNKCNEVWYHRGGHLYFETGLSYPTIKQYNKLKQVLNLDNKYDFIVEKYIFNVDTIRVDRNPNDKRHFANTKQLMKNVWYFNNKLEMAEYNHPTIKPIKMIEMLIKASSNENDIVCDPFMGSGTTAVACKELGRNFIGFEISEEYCKIAEERLKKVNNRKLKEWFNVTTKSL